MSHILKPQTRVLVYSFKYAEMWQAWKVKKLQGFLEDKYSNGMKVLIRKLHKKLLSDPWKGKVDSQIATCKLLIRTLIVFQYILVKVIQTIIPIGGYDWSEYRNRISHNQTVQALVLAVSRFYYLL